MPRTHHVYVPVPSSPWFTVPFWVEDGVVGIDLEEPAPRTDASTVGGRLRRERLEALLRDVHDHAEREGLL